MSNKIELAFLVYSRSVIGMINNEINKGDTCNSRHRHKLTGTKKRVVYLVRNRGPSSSFWDLCAPAGDVLHIPNADVHAELFCHKIRSSLND